jgi:hypothetical protein
VALDPDDPDEEVVPESEELHAIAIVTSGRKKARRMTGG